MSMEYMNDRAFYMNIYGNVIASPLLLCDQWADSTLTHENDNAESIFYPILWSKDGTPWLHSFYGAFFPCIQEHGLSIRKHDLLISHADFVILSIKPCPCTQIALACEHIWSASAQTVCSDILLLAQIHCAPASVLLALRLLLWTLETSVLRFLPSSWIFSLLKLCLCTRTMCYYMCQTLPCPSLLLQPF